MRVTWMIPVLNGMPYLRETLASIEAQAYKDAQIIVWDNGSTDGTVEEAKRWIPSRIPGQVVTGRALPLGLARAAMVEQCRTEFGALIDADDINLPDRLHRQIAFMDAHPDIAVVGTQLIAMNQAGEDQAALEAYPLDHERIVQEMLRSNPVGQPSVLFRCAAVKAVGNYRDFSPTHVEDFDLWLRLAAGGFRLANLPEALVRYRVHESSTTQKSIAAGRLNAEVLCRLQEAAPKLFNCDGATMRRLKLRQKPLAIRSIFRIARHLGNPWKSPVFVRAARDLIARTDVVSRLVFAIKTRVP